MTHKHAATKRLKEAHNHAAAHGGTCLTTTPIRERANFEFSCPNGHKNFFKRHDSIRQGKYCPACSMELKGKNQIKYTKADLDLHAASRGGSCLSDSYLGWDVNHRWRCDHGHEWDAKPRMIIAMDSWCPDCAGNRKYNLEELNVLATVRGGNCLDLAYDAKSERSSADWKCSFGHIWRARVDMVVRRGDWCPHCKTSYGERLCRQIIEKLYGVTFPKVRPSWLRGDKGLPLEIDMFNPDFFGLEYQGKHHFKPTGYTHDTLVQISARDALKVAQCEKKEIKLVIVPQFNNILDPEACIREVKLQLANHGIEVPDHAITIDYRSVYVNTEGIAFFKALNEYVAHHGGSLISDHFAGVSRNYRVACRHGHQFTLNKYDMPRNKWCPECVKEERYQKYCRIVEVRGGKMISERYESCYTPMEIEYFSGKRFALTPHQLAHGVWVKE